MRRPIFSTLIFSLIFSLILPSLTVFAKEDDPALHLGPRDLHPSVLVDGDHLLDLENNCYNVATKTVSRADSADFCDAYFVQTDTDYLYLNNYVGSTITVKNQDTWHTEIYLSGENIIASDQIGLSFNCARSVNFHFNDSASLTIDIDSPTDTAIGILYDKSQLTFHQNSNLKINLRSALPLDIPSTSNVAAISLLGESSNVAFDLPSTVLIDNPTGTYSVYADNVIHVSNTETINSQIVFKATHKLGGGVSVSDNLDLVHYLWFPKYTFTHTYENNIGTFELFPDEPSTNATFDDYLEDGASFLDTEARMKNTLTSYTSLPEDDSAFAHLDQLYPLPKNAFYNNFFTIDAENSFLLDTTDPENRETITKDHDYDFWVAFTITDKTYRFAHRQSLFYSGAIINDRFITPTKTNHTRSTDGLHETLRYRLSVSEPKEPEKPTEPEEPTEPENPTEPEVPELPETPEENPNTSTENLSLISLLFFLSLMIQLAYHGKIIFSLRRYGLRKNHATPPSRF